MDAVDVLILALRLLLVALLYLFVVVVLRTAIGATRSSASRRLRLRVVEAGESDLEPGEVLAVPAGTTFGRGGQADVVLSDTAISAEHARVERVGRRWVVADLGSTNGTRVNETVVRGRAALSEGDVLTLGTIRLQVVAR